MSLVGEKSQLVLYLLNHLVFHRYHAVNGRTETLLHDEKVGALVHSFGTRVLLLSHTYHVFVVSSLVQLSHLRTDDATWHNFQSLVH